VAALRGVAAGCVLAVSDVPGSGGSRRVDAERFQEIGLSVGEAGYAAVAGARTR
jgi:hypothetical protein